MSFDITALNAFRNAGLGGEKAIANLGQGDKVVKKNDYYGPIGKIFRGGTAKAANNAVRTELLRSLGNAFGLEGVGRNDKGVVTFSKDFMDKLAQLLGPEFKRDDFGVGADGTVKSGKPLTQRRITSIVRQATLAARGEFDAAIYRAKLGSIGEALAKMPPNTKCVDAAKAYFAYAGKCLDFLENDFEGLLQENPDWSEHRAKTDPDYDVPRFCFVRPGQYEGEPCANRKEFVNYIAYESTIKPVLHYELYHNLPKELNTPEDVKTLKDYVRNTIRMYIQTAADLFLDAQKAGKLPELLEKINDNPGACMDDKASRPGEWRKALGLMGANDLSGVAMHDKDQPLNQCIGNVISAIAKANPDNVGKWEDVADQVKKDLVGVIRPIDVPEIVTSRGEDGEELVEHKFRPLVGETGKPVVRAITEADIDAIGPAVLDTILYG